MNLKSLSVLLALVCLGGILGGCSGEQNKPEDSMESVLKNAHIDPHGTSKNAGPASKDTHPPAGETTGTTGQ